MAIHTYEITVTPHATLRAWDAAPFVLTCPATSARAAVRWARTYVRHVIGHGRQDGPLTYSAKRVAPRAE